MSLSILRHRHKSSSFINVVTNDHHIFFIQSSIERHQGCFHILVILSNAALNKGLHISFLISVFIVFKKKAEKEAKSYSNCILNFMKHLHTSFCSGYENLHSQKQCPRVPLSPHPC